ncbi:MAG: homoserine kinase [Alphaproteobacteria bacterium]|nr:homoserine kinase [Alphaproteobacteria bacterium]
MAVYTHLSHEDIAAFLAQYDVGALESFNGITEGVSNTNYLLTTHDSRLTTHQYILTLFERRFNIEELPYFVALMEWFSARGISCPQPIKMRDGRALSALAERPALMVSFLQGAGVEPRKITPAHLLELGQMVAKMHVAGMGFPHTRRNGLSLPAWEAMIDEMNGRADEISEGLTKFISEEYNYLSEHWPNDLPSGPIHADIFPDNVFFDRDRKLSGVIDFYFACHDFWAYDLAICVNAWCFDDRRRLQKDRVAALMQGYNDIRPLTHEEEMSLPLLLRGAALRFLLTRTYDALFPPEGAEITPKDPLEYLAKLEFFQGHMP